MDSMIIGSFGKSIIFEVHEQKILTPQTVEHEIEATYEEHAVLGTKPRLEFIAPKLEVFTLSILFSASLGVNPRATMQEVIEVVNNGIVENLILGGTNYGKFVAIKAKETWVKSLHNGTPMSIKAELAFKEYMQ